MENGKSAVLKQSFLIAFVAICMLMAVLALGIAFEEARANNGGGQHFIAVQGATRTPYATAATTASPTPAATEAAAVTPVPARPTYMIDPDLE